VRRIDRGRCRDARQKGGISQTQFVCRLPKVALGSLFGSIETRTPVDTVYVKFKDLSFGVAFLDFPSQPKFPQFSPVRLPRVQESVLGELSRQRAPTLFDFSGPEVGPRRPGNPS